MAITCSSSSLICFSSESTSRSSSLNLFYSKPNIIIRTHLVFYPRNQKRLNFSVSDKWRNRVSFFSGFSTNRVESLKEELFQAIKPLDRGAEASPEDQARVDQIARKLEAVNDVKEPLKSNLLNGKWELLFTTSQSLLQTKRPKFLRPNGKIYQAINVDTLRAQNLETWPFFNQATTNLVPLNSRRVAVKFDYFRIGVMATANLVPLNSRRVAVKFDYFRIGGLITIKSPGSGRGQLEITYLDEELSFSAKTGSLKHTQVDFRIAKVEIRVAQIN